MTTLAGHCKGNKMQGEIALEERKNLNAAKGLKDAADRR
jgi:hypothetical protein